MFTIVMALFPKELPRASVRRCIAAEKERRKKVGILELKEPVEVEETSMKDFFVTCKRLMMNKVFMVNNFSTIFYTFG